MGDAPALSEKLPLSALLSGALVAFTIEVDNEFEHQMPHRTTRYGATPGIERPPWLVSLPMWVHCLRYVPEDGIAAAELVRRSGLGVDSMRMIVKRMSSWWGYLTLDPAGPKARAADRIIRTSPAGALAATIWAPLPGRIEDRWRQRLGAGSVEALRSALIPLVGRLAPRLPDYLPLGLTALRRSPAAPAAVGDLPLFALLSKPLLALALDFGSRSRLRAGQYTASPTGQLAIVANLLRVLAGGPLPAAQLPARTGVATMALDNWLGALQPRYLSVERDPSGRRQRIVTLGAEGRNEARSYHEWAADVHRRWRHDHGKSVVDDLRAALEPIAGDLGRGSPLAAGVNPYPDGWRARLPAPDTLPHYPVISHRGGYPDGS